MSEFLNNRTRRVEPLKTIDRRLHAGEAPAEVKIAMKTLVQEVDAAELISMEQQLIAEGVPVREIQGMCDLHSQVAREVLTTIAPAVDPGHQPVLGQVGGRVLRSVNSIVQFIEESRSSPAARPLAIACW